MTNISPPGIKLSPAPPHPKLFPNGYDVIGETVTVYLTTQVKCKKTSRKRKFYASYRTEDGKVVGSHEVDTPTSIKACMNNALRAFSTQVDIYVKSGYTYPKGKSPAWLQPYSPSKGQVVAPVKVINGLPKKPLSLIPRADAELLAHFAERANPTTVPQGGKRPRDSLHRDHTITYHDLDVATHARAYAALEDKSTRKSRKRQNETLNSRPVVNKPSHALVSAVCPKQYQIGLKINFPLPVTNFVRTDALIAQILGKKYEPERAYDKIAENMGHKYFPKSLKEVLAQLKLTTAYTVEIDQAWQAICRDKHVVEHRKMSARISRALAYLDRKFLSGTHSATYFAFVSSSCLNDQSFPRQQLDSVAKRLKKANIAKTLADLFIAAKPDHPRGEELSELADLAVSDFESQTKTQYKSITLDKRTLSVIQDLLDTELSRLTEPQSATEDVLATFFENDVVSTIAILGAIASSVLCFYYEGKTRIALGVMAGTLWSFVGFNLLYDVHRILKSAKYSFYYREVGNFFKKCLSKVVGYFNGKGLIKLDDISQRTEEYDPTIREYDLAFKLIDTHAPRMRAYLVKEAHEQRDEINVALKKLYSYVPTNYLETYRSDGMLESRWELFHLLYSNPHRADFADEYWLLTMSLAPCFADDKGFWTPSKNSIVATYGDRKVYDEAQIIANLDPKHLHHSQPVAETAGKRDVTDPLPPRRKVKRDVPSQALSSDTPPQAGPSKQQAKPQGYAFVDEILEHLKAFGAWIGDNASVDVWKNRSRTFSAIWKGLVDAGALWRWVVPFLMTAVNMVSIKISGQSVWVNKSNELMKAVLLQTAAVNKISTHLATGRNPQELAPDFNRAALEHQRMAVMSKALDEGDKSVKAFQDYTKLFNTLVKEMRSRDAQLNPRTEPVGILLPGDPGIGKTQFASFLAGLLHFKGYLRNPGVAQIDHKRNFNDCWTDQATLMVDEWCTMNDKTARMEDVEFLIDNINATPQLIERAAVEEKSLYWVNNQLLILTTNVELHVLNDLAAKEAAIARRLPFVIDIHPPKRCKGRFPSINGQIDWNQFRYTVSIPADDATYKHHAPPENTMVPITRVVQLVSQLLVEKAELAHASRLPSYGAYNFDAIDLPVPVVPPEIVPIQVAKDSIPVAQGPIFMSNEWAKDCRKFVTWASTKQEETDEPRPMMFSELVAAFDEGRSPFKFVLTAIDPTTDREFDMFRYLSLRHRETTLLHPKSKLDDIAEEATQAVHSPLYEALHRASSTLGNTLSAATSKVRSALGVSSPTTWKDKLSACWSGAKSKFRRLVVGAITLAFPVEDVVSSLLIQALVLLITCVLIGLLIYGAITLIPVIYNKTTAWWSGGDSSRPQAFANYHNTIRERWREARQEEFREAYDYDEEFKRRERAKHMVGGSRSKAKPQAPPDLRSLATRATVLLTSSRGMVFRAFSPGGHMVVMPHHYLYELASANEVRVSTPCKEGVIRVSDTIVVSIPEDDVCAFMLPKTFESFPFIMDRFVLDADVKKINAQISMYLTNLKDVREYTSIVSTSPEFITWHGRGEQGDTRYHPLCFTTPMRTEVGDCGSLYAAHQPDLRSRTLFGMHCAGTGDLAHANILTQERLGSLYDRLNPDWIKEVGAPIAHPQGPAPPTGETFEVPGRDAIYSNVFLQFHADYSPGSPDRDALCEERRQHLTSEEVAALPSKAIYVGRSATPQHITRKSRLRRSRVSHAFGVPVGVPAVLSKTQSQTGEDPLILAHRRMQGPPPIIVDHEVFKQCVKASLQFIPRHPTLRCVLSIQEACYGFGVLKPLDHTASAGVPWNGWASQRSKPANKGTWLGTSEKPNMDPLVVEYVERCMTLLKQGKVPDWVSSEQLKDEVVTPEKFANSKTRLYYAADLTSTIIGRMLFGAWMNATMVARPKHPGKVSTSVGISPDELTLNALYKAALAEDPKAGDQKGFDMHQSWELAQHIADALNEWYPSKESQEIKLARKTYLYSMYHSLIQSEDHIYTLDFLMPSGCVLTSPLNSLYLEACTIYVIDRCLRSTGMLLSPSNIKESMFALYYGDDSFTVTPKSWELSSPMMFKEFYHLGLEATHCVKDWKEDEVPFEYLTFLRRKPMLNPDGNFVWALDKETIEDMIHWVKKSDISNFDVLRSTARNALIEARRHGIAYFKDLYERLSDAFEAVQPGSFFLTEDPAAYAISRI